ncbi:MAG: hypothetical protein ACOY5Y_08835 [Pseudomonadota bacterium]|jgi:hypothetical protein
MIRFLTVAAAAALIASPAAAQSVTIDTSGKNAQELHVAIADAAKKVCRKAVVGASFPREMYASCYKAAVKTAVAKVGSAELAQAAGIEMAEAR